MKPSFDLRGHAFVAQPTDARARAKAIERGVLELPA
jgi:hypothetical protein